MPRRLALTAALILSVLPSAWACGGNGQAPCTTAPASFKHGIRCDGGSFYDPRNGGECWTCSGWNRSAAAVNASNGCYVPGYTAKKSASYVKSTAWAWDCKGGSFWDPRKGGQCWSCGGWNRTASAVTASDACSKAIPEQDRPGTFVKAAHCTAGEFSDPRNGGECWTCPAGYNRTGSPVTASDACVAQQRCDAGSIEYGGACWTKNACGTNGGRACTVGERLPSCDQGLMEDRGRCVPLPPGQSAFLAGLGAAATNVSKDGMKACDAAFASLPKLHTGNPFLDGETACNKAQMTGFLCAATGLPGQLGGATALIGKISAEYDRDPCKTLGVLAPQRALCSTAMAMGRDMVDAIECIGQASSGGAFKNVDPIVLCRLEGELGFQAALMAAGGAVAAEGEAAEGAAAGAAQESGILMKIAQALFKANGVLSKANSANKFADQMHQYAACQRLAGQTAQGQAAVKASFDLPYANTPDRVLSADLLLSRVSPSGTFTLLGKKVGNGWGGAAHIIPSGGGVVYTIAPNGDLTMYRHDENGAFLSAKKIGNGWSDAKFVLSEGPGELAMVKPDGTLWLYRHDEAGVFTTTKQIGSGWGGFTKVLSGGGGILYGVDAVGDLLYYRYENDGASWPISGQKIGNAWGGFPVMLAGGKGELYVVDSSDVLYRYFHRPDGEWILTHEKIGNGWMAKFGDKISMAPDGTGDIYGVVK